MHTSVARGVAIALAVGAGDLRGAGSEYNMPYSEWTTSMFFLQGAMVTVYASWSCSSLSPLGFRAFLGADRQDVNGELRSLVFVGLSTA
ncbi:DUF2534 family protein [Klebsiella pneumoniae]|nr:DUF2534 family protein [Klebsiella pneumoniae]